MTYTIQDAIDFYESRIKEEAERLPRFIMGPEHNFIETMNTINMLKAKLKEIKLILGTLQIANYKSRT